MVVKALRYEGVAENYPGSVRIITKEEIEKIPAKDVPDLLKSIAGVEVYKRGDRNYDIDFRGFNNGTGCNSRILLLINGVVAKNSDAGQNDWDLININEIEKIEILKGSAGGVYGNTAVAGVINIITTKRKMMPETSLEFICGSFNKVGTFVNLNRKSKNNFFSIKANYENSDAYRKKENYQTKNVKLGFQNINENSSLTADMLYSEGSQTYGSALSENEIQQYGNSYQGNRITTQEFKIAKWNTEFKNYFDNNAWSKINLNYKNRYYAYDKSYGVESKNYDYSLFFNLFKKFYLTKKVSLEIFTGIDFSEENIKSKDVELKSKILGTYIKNNLLLSKFLASLSYRYNILDNKYMGKSEYKKLYKMDNYYFGLSYNFKNENKIFINFSHSFSIPDRDRIVKYEYVPITYEITNISLRDIKPEKAKQVELGFNVSPLKNLNANSTLFYIIVEDEIFYNGSVNTNMKEVSHKGIENEINLNLFEKIEFKLSHAYQKIIFTKGEFKNKIVPLSPENILSAGISFSFLKSFTVSYITRWRDKCFPANDLENKYKKLEDYSVTDLKLIYKKSSIKFEFNIYNLYNNNYYEYVAVSRGTGKVGYYPMASRHYEASVTFYF